jgi:hypothetical protein
MKQTIAILAVCLAVSGCRNPNVTRVPIVLQPEAIPSNAEQMSPEKAAALLGVTLPVEVDDFAGFDDGGTVKGSLHGADGKYIAFRRTPWAWGDPIEFYLTFYAGKGLEEMKQLKFKHEEVKVSQDDPRLKAFSVLCLNWVDRNFQKTELMRIRDGFPPKKESDAGYILNLFGPEEE